MLSIARLALAIQQMPALSTSFVGQVQVNKCNFEAHLNPQCTGSVDTETFVNDGKLNVGCSTYLTAGTCLAAGAMHAAGE